MQRTTSAFDGRHDGKPAHGDLERTRFMSSSRQKP